MHKIIDVDTTFRDVVDAIAHTTGCFIVSSTANYSYSSNYSANYSANYSTNYSANYSTSYSSHYSSNYSSNYSANWDKFNILLFSYKHSL